MNTPSVPKLLLDYCAAAKTLSISKSKLEKLVYQGEIPSVQIGTRRLFDPDDLRVVGPGERGSPGERQPPSAVH